MMVFTKFTLPGEVRKDSDFLLNFQNLVSFYDKKYFFVITMHQNHIQSVTAVRLRLRINKYPPAISNNGNTASPTGVGSPPGVGGPTLRGPDECAEALSAAASSVSMEGEEAYILLLPSMADVERNVADGISALLLNELLPVIHCAEAETVQSTITTIV